MFCPIKQNCADALLQVAAEEVLLNSTFWEYWNFVQRSIETCFLPSLLLLIFSFSPFLSFIKNNWVPCAIRGYSFLCLPASFTRRGTKMTSGHTFREMYTLSSEWISSCCIIHCFCGGWRDKKRCAGRDMKDHHRTSHFWEQNIPNV